MKKIVVGYDGSAQAGRALERAARLSGGAGDVAVVTVAPFLVSNARTGKLTDPRADRERDELLLEANALLRRRGIAVVSFARRGKPAEAIVKAAREIDADLIVVGTCGRNRALRLLLGSVSDAVVRGARCDVLVVR